MQHTDATTRKETAAAARMRSLSIATAQIVTKKHGGKRSAHARDRRKNEANAAANHEEDAALVEQGVGLEQKWRVEEGSWLLHANAGRGQWIGLGRVRLRCR